MELIAQIEARNLSLAATIDLANEVAFANDYRGRDLPATATREEAYAHIKYIYGE